MTLKLAKTLIAAQMIFISFGIVPVSSTRPHKTLHESRLEGEWKNYWVSTDRYLDEGSLKEIVCSIVKQDRLADYNTIRIWFFHDLKEYMPNAFYYSPEEHQAYLKSQGRYFFSRKLLNDPDYFEIEIFKNSNGQEYRRKERPRFRFNHDRQCGEH